MFRGPEYKDPLRQRPQPQGLVLRLRRGLFLERLWPQRRQHPEQGRPLLFLAPERQERVEHYPEEAR